MPATLIPTSPDSRLYRETVNKFWSTWSDPTKTKPRIVNVFYVNHERHRVWYNYEAYKKKVGNEQYMWHGTTRACTIGDDNSQVTACNLPNCSLCHILRSTLDPTRGKSNGMLGRGAYVAPNSNKSYDLRHYLFQADPSTSPNFVMIRCAVAVGKTYVPLRTKGGVTMPSGYDSVSARKGYTLNQWGRTVSNDETAVFTGDAILPVEIVVLRNPNSTYVNRNSSYNRKLRNMTDADWDKYPEAIRNSYKGEILWTDGNDGYSFASAPNIRAYKVVRKDSRGNVVAHGYAASNPFYFKLV